MGEMKQLALGDQSVALYEATSTDPAAPGVGLFHPWWGLNDDVKAFADRLAAAGFHVLAPDMFNGGIAETVEEAERLSRSADDDRCSAVTLAAIDRLLEGPGASKKLGVVGFSFGAAWAIWSAAQRDQIAATVVYYGTWVGEILGEASTPVLGHFAEDDPYEDADTVSEFEKMLRDAGRDTTIHIYRGTGHWFAEPSKDAYRAEPAELAFDRTVEFVRGRLVR
jgi:carboxymethylenebutenolidase